MGVRSTLASFLSGPAARLLERELRDLVDDVLASRPVADTSEVDELRREVVALRSAAPSGDDRLTALEGRIEAIEKRLSMAMGAVQASTAQLMAVRQTAEEAQAAAKQAGQHATSAKATAESAVDGITGLEERLDDLAEQLQSAGPSLAADAPEPPAPPARPSGAVSRASDDAGCRLPGCTGKHRARGFCARHYQQFRRSTLDGVVGPDGVLPLEGETLTVGAEHAGKLARREDDRLLLDGEPVAV